MLDSSQVTLLPTVVTQTLLKRIPQNTLILRTEANGSKCMSFWLSGPYANRLF